MKHFHFILLVFALVALQVASQGPSTGDADVDLELFRRDVAQARSEGDAFDVVRNYGLLLTMLFIVPGLLLYLTTRNAPFPSISQSPMLVTINIRYLSFIGWLGAVISIFGSVILSMLTHWDAVTKTHCRNTPNPLPSISAAVGYDIDERIMFRFGILILSWQRIFDGLMLYRWFEKELPQNNMLYFVNKLSLWCHTAENISLFVLAYVSSIEHYETHEKGFIFWVLFQFAKIFLHMYLFLKARGPNFTPSDAKLWTRKKILVGVDVFALFAAFPVFIIHSSTCIPYLYSLFALLEYTLVASNILFNLAMVAHFPEDTSLIISQSTHLVSASTALTDTHA